MHQTKQAVLRVNRCDGLTEAAQDRKKTNKPFFINEMILNIDSCEGGLIFAPAEDVGAEHAANDVAQVGDVVDVRQCAGHQHVAFAFPRQTASRGENTQQI